MSDSVLNMEWTETDPRLVWAKFYLPQPVDSFRAKWAYSLFQECTCQGQMLNHLGCWLQCTEANRCADAYLLCLAFQYRYFKLALKKDTDCVEFKKKIMQLTDVKQLQEFFVLEKIV